MTGPTPTPRVFRFYQYDPPAAFVLQTPVRPKAILVPENELHIHNSILFERPVLYIGIQQKAALPNHILADSKFMDFLRACSWSIPLEDLPKDSTQMDRNVHTYKKQESCDLFIRLANEQFPPAQHYIGLCTLFGSSGFEKNLNTAVHFILSAAIQKYAPAQVTLGYLHEHGIAVPLNLGYAVSLYEDATRKQNPLALYLLGICYEYGHGVTQNLRKAAALYQQSLKLHFIPANYAIKSIYNKTINQKTTLSIMVKSTEAPNYIPSPHPSLLPASSVVIPLPPKRKAPQKKSSSKRRAVPLVTPPPAVTPAQAGVQLKQ